MKLKFFSVITLILFISTGCQNNQPQGNPSSSPSDANRKQQVQKISVDDQTKQRENFSSETANRLVQLALKDPNVHDATAVVIGKYAVVGIDVPKDLDASRVGTIKYSVAQTLKSDPQGANALVTADPDLFQRLRDMAASIREGHPVAGIADQLADIVNRIIPQVPKQVEERKPVTPTPPMNIRTH